MLKLFALAVFMFIVVGGVILGFARRDRTSNEAPPIDNIPTVRTPRPKPKTATPVPTMQTNTWQTITVSPVALKAPKEWQATSVTALPEEKLIEVKPLNRANDELIPRLFVRIQNKQKTSAELEAVRLRGVGFQETGEHTIAGQKAKAYTMLLPGDSFTKGNPKKQDVLQTIYLFEKDKSVYHVDIAYYNDSQKDAMLKTLSTIGLSVTLQ